MMMRSLKRSMKNQYCNMLYGVIEGGDINQGNIGEGEESLMDYFITGIFHRDSF